MFTGGAGVSVAQYKDTRAERQEAITAQLHAIINRVQFCDTPDELASKSRVPLQNTSRAFVVVQTPTTTSGDFSQLLDIAKQVSDSYLSGTDSGVTRIQFRIVVLVGERYDLIAKMEERGKMLWPEWTFIVVQLRKEVLQSNTVRPSYAVVLALPGDILEEPTTITLPKCLIAEQGVNMRCTEANCPYRKTVLDAAAAKKVSQDDEIQIGDRMFMLDSKLEQAEKVNEAVGQGEGCHGEGEKAAAAEGADKDTLKHDCIVNLWPYAHSTSYYHEILGGLACADKASVGIIVSTTAHPGHWVACVEEFHTSTFVLTRRWSARSAAHGLSLGMHMLRARLEKSVGLQGVMPQER